MYVDVFHVFVFTLTLILIDVYDKFIHLSYLVYMCVFIFTYLYHVQQSQLKGSLLNPDSRKAKHNVGQETEHTRMATACS